jgi:hypothetical protein
MQIIAPSYITDTNLIFCDISATSSEYPEWDDTVSYITGQRVSVNYEIDGITPGVHRIYECMWHTPDNLNLYPPDHVAIESGNIWWTRISATNRWRLFDQIVSPDRATVEANVNPTVWESGTVWGAGTAWAIENYASMRVDVTPGLIDSIAVMNADLTNMAVIMTDPVEGEVYNEEKVTSPVTEYNGVFGDLPAYPNATVSVSARNSAGDLAIGEIVFGRARTIGIAKYGIDVGIVDYSQKDADAYGNFSILERSYSKKIGCRFMMPILTHSGILRLLEKYRAVPLVWIISNLYSTTIAYGFYRDLQVSIPYPTLAEGSVNIEGLGADYVHATPIPDVSVPPWSGTNQVIIPLLIPTIDEITTAVIEEAPVAPAALTLAVPFIVPTLSVFSFLKVADCTISNTEPLVVTCVGHGLADDARVMFYSTGALPTPLVAGHMYFVMYIDPDTFNLSLTVGGSEIDATGAGSGTHSLYTAVV